MLYSYHSNSELTLISIQHVRSACQQSSQKDILPNPSIPRASDHSPPHAVQEPTKYNLRIHRKRHGRCYPRSVTLYQRRVRQWKIIWQIFYAKTCGIDWEDFSRLFYQVESSITEFIRE